MSLFEELNKKIENDSRIPEEFIATPKNIHQNIGYHLNYLCDIVEEKLNKIKDHQKQSKNLLIELCIDLAYGERLNQIGKMYGLKRINSLSHSESDIDFKLRIRSHKDKK